MPYIVTIAYPNDDESTFDLSYYLTSHMPMVESHWKALGLLRWELVEFESQNDSQKALFKRANIMAFEDKASFTAASEGPVADQIFGDIPNFSNRQPVILVGNLIKSG
jgi:uncharacterized protein (TIGR02118 family)